MAVVLIPIAMSGALAPSAALAQTIDATEQRLYDEIRANPTDLERMRAYLNRYPLGYFREQVMALFDRASEDVVWAEATALDTRQAYEDYLRLYPNGRHSDEARRLAARPPAERLVIHPETRLIGAIVSQRVLRDHDSCYAACNSDRSCKGYDFSLRTNVCNLFVEYQHGEIRSDSTAGTRGPLNRRLPPLPQTPPEPQPPPQTQPPPMSQLPVEQPKPTQPAPPEFERYVNRDITGGADRRFNARSVDHCEAECVALAGCRAYTYNAWNRGLCFLKSNVGNLKVDARATTGVVKGTRPNNSSAPVTFEFFNNKAFPGRGYRSAPGSSRGQCESICWGDDRCIAFNFARGQRMCDLFSQAGEYSTRNGYDAGAKRQF